MHFFFNHFLTEHAHIFEMLREKNNRVFITASHGADVNLGPLIADNYLSEPKILDKTNEEECEAYVEWVLKQALTEGADVVWPYKNRILLAKYASRFESSGVKLLVSAPFETLEFIENKPVFLEEMGRNGFNVSPSVKFTDLKGFDEGLRFFEGQDVCIKPTSGVGGVGYRRLLKDCSVESMTSSDPMVIGIDMLRALLAESDFSQEMMLMPYLECPERSVDVACWEGQALGVVTRTRQSNGQVVGDNEISRNMAISLVGHLGLSGLINVQTRIDHKGEQTLLEINTRASGGIGWTRVSGVNLPGLVLDALSGQPAKTCVVPEKDILAIRRYNFHALV